MAKRRVQPIYICLRIEWGTEEQNLLGPMRDFLVLELREISL